MPIGFEGQEALTIAGFAFIFSTRGAFWMLITFIKQRTRKCETHSSDLEENVKQGMMIDSGGGENEAPARECLEQFISDY